MYRSHRIECIRVDRQLLQYFPAKPRSDIGRHDSYPPAIFHARVAALSFGPVDADKHVGLPRELAELTNEVVLVRQGSLSSWLKLDIVLFRTNVQPVGRNKRSALRLVSPPC